MDNQSIQYIHNLKRKWVISQLLADVLLAVAITLTVPVLLLGLSALHYVIFFSPVKALLVFVLCLAAFILVRQPWKLTLFSITGFLNRLYPELEESAELLIKPSNELTLLQTLQLTKVETAIANVPGFPKPFIRRLTIALGFLVAAILLAFLTNGIKVVLHVTGDNLVPSTSSKSTAENILPQIDKVRLTITPPSYTSRSSREQDKFTILAEEGSTVKWEIHTNIAVKQLILIFNDREQVALKPNTDKIEWTTSRTIDKPGFYQVKVDGKLSDLYQIETIKDTPPVIHIKTPKQYTYIDAGEKPLVNLTTTINDDYGISDALIYATVAKGNGEGVKFKEYQIPFGQSFQNNSTVYNLQHLFDLPKLNMEPGDELYFYIEAKDNHQQKTRTDVYTVSIQDTTALLSMDGIVNGTNLKPEFFRSERQIIMDTEQLLKSRDTLSKEKFNRISGDIGADQKLLRLRYGKFLGEEDESSVGGIGENNELGKVENFNNAAMILDAMTDKHDNAEDASYLEASVKNQLKATLNEMWNAELHLRMYKPQDALPFEYKALRLLKDLQQKSRAYVAKTAYHPTPLKMEKRLSGDLDKINQPVNKQEIKPGTDAYENLKNVVQVLEQIRTARMYSDADKHTLQLVKQQLGVKASAQPGVYLAAVSAVNRILSAPHPQLTDIDLVERVIQKTLPLSARVPQNNVSRPDMGLSQRYYQNLKSNR